MSETTAKPPSASMMAEALSSAAMMPPEAMMDVPAVNAASARLATARPMPVQACQLRCPDGSARLAGSPAQ
ncbi:hypothetical protein LQD23_18870 [Chromobacterium violaceum]|uniref:hypothetical protein n=1 Tax=Chromobacterium violaceum TaxID=536 RepID=UPI001E31B4E2|nr:hypothetical protein [Chromobacterium violaceum]MCD0494341.1 hypothetical protein [Chromobacterium violaceum]